MNNINEIWYKVKPEEIQSPCFNCEECCTWSGECRHRQQAKENCNNFVLSDYGAERNKKKFLCDYKRELKLKLFMREDVDEIIKNYIDRF